MAGEAETPDGSLKGGAGSAEETKAAEEEPARGPAAVSFAPIAWEAPLSSTKECPVGRSPFDLERHAPPPLLIRGWSATGGTQQAEGVKRPEEEPATVPLSSPPDLPSSEETECPVCRSPFDLERHAPKLLECLHTFCRQCLRQLHLRAAAQDHGEGGDCAEQGYRAIICPLCRHPTVLPDSLVESLPANLRLAKSSPPPPPDHLLQPEHAHQRPLWEQPGAGTSASSAARTSREEERWSGVLVRCRALCYCLILFLVFSAVGGGVSYMKNCRGRPDICWEAIAMVTSIFFSLVYFMGCLICSCRKWL